MPSEPAGEDTLRRKGNWTLERRSEDRKLPSGLVAIAAPERLGGVVLVEQGPDGWKRVGLGRPAREGGVLRQHRSDFDIFVSRRQGSSWKSK